MEARKKITICLEYNMRDASEMRNNNSMWEECCNQQKLKREE